MENNIALDAVLANLSERGQIEWALAVERTKVQVLEAQLAAALQPEPEVADGER